MQRADHVAHRRYCSDGRKRSGLAGVLASPKSAHRDQGLAGSERRSPGSGFTLWAILIDGWRRIADRREWPSMSEELV